MHPSEILLLISGIIKSGSIANEVPKPSQEGQAPNGELNEKILAYKARLTYQKLLDKGYRLRD